MKLNSPFATKNAAMAGDWESNSLLFIDSATMDSMKIFLSTALTRDSTYGELAFNSKWCFER